MRQPEDRQSVLDRLRGFALLGVLLVNTPFLMTSVNGMSDASMPLWYDRLAGFLTWFLFQAKSYVIFSFLFGYSLAVLLERVDRKGLDGQRVYRQRLVALAVIGAVHAVVLFVGDILVVYAVLGSSLLWLRKRADRTLIRVAAGLFVVQALIFALLLAFPGGDLGDTAWIDASWSSDGLLGASWTRLQVWPAALVFVLALQGPLVAALFCLGLVAGRRNLLADPANHRARLVRMLRWGLTLGLPLQVGGALLGTWPGIDDSPRRTVVALAITYLSAPILSAAYVSAIALLPRRGVAKAIEADGRMSLSVYLGESLLMTTLAAGWGFGLFGLNTGAASLVALGVWLTLFAWSNLWHRYAGGGPAERLLRLLTYRGLSAGTQPSQRAQT